MIEQTGVSKYSRPSWWQRMRGGGMVGGGGPGSGNLKMRGGGNPWDWGMTWTAGGGGGGGAPLGGGGGGGGHHVGPGTVDPSRGISFGPGGPGPGSYATAEGYGGINWGRAAWRAFEVTNAFSAFGRQGAVVTRPGKLGASLKNWITTALYRPQSLGMTRSFSRMLADQIAVRQAESRELLRRALGPQSGAYAAAMRDTEMNLANTANQAMRQYVTSLAEMALRGGVALKSAQLQSEAMKYAARKRASGGGLLGKLGSLVSIGKTALEGYKIGADLDLWG